jgi:hypothetical protein
MNPSFPSLDLYVQVSIHIRYFLFISDFTRYLNAEFEIRLLDWPDIPKFTSMDELSAGSVFEMGNFYTEKK